MFSNLRGLMCAIVYGATPAVKKTWFNFFESLKSKGNGATEMAMTTPAKTEPTPAV